MPDGGCENITCSPGSSSLPTPDGKTHMPLAPQCCRNVGCRFLRSGLQPERKLRRGWRWENDMQAKLKILGRSVGIMSLVLSLMLPGMAHAGKKERAIALGIGIGMLGGALASNGDPRAVIGGAVAGGLIGSVAQQRDRREWRDDRRSWREDRRWRHDHRRDHRDWRR